MRNLTEADYEKIITGNLVFGKTQASIAEELGIKPSIVSVVVSGFNAVKRQDWENVIARINSNQSLKIYAWAAERLGTKLPPEVINANEARKAKLKEKKNKQEEPTVVEQPTEKPSTEEKNETIYFCRLLEEIARQNELLEQLMDVVIPKYVNDLKDNQNANFDAQTAEIKKGLDQIAANTRKRGL